MSDHILGLRKAKGAGWATGVVHARVRHGEAALELRGASYHLTLRNALEALGEPDRLNGHGGVSATFLGATAGLAARDAILRNFLATPGAVLGQLYRAAYTGVGRARLGGLTQRDWARRAGVSVSTIRRILNGSQAPSLSTARRLLEALQ